MVAGNAVKGRQLRWRCDPAALGGPSTARIDPSDAWIGEERARAAVEMALDIAGNSHHLVLRGVAGSGRRTLLRQCLARAGSDPGRDLVFVGRFDRPDRPRLLTFAPGDGRRFVDNVDRLVQEMGELRGSTRADALAVVRAALGRLREVSAGREARQHVIALRKQLLADLPRLRAAEAEPGGPSTRRYAANLVRDARERAGRALVELSGVDHRRLLGAMDAPDDDECPSVLDLAGGALLEADGGVCLIPADELLADPALLRRLLRTLHRGAVQLGPVPGSATPAIEDYQPDPVPLRTRVVVLSASRVLADGAARRVFGLLARCNSTIPWSEDTGRHLARWTAHRVREEGLRHVRADGLARLLEAQVRDAGGKGRISCHLGELGDRLREADRLAGREGRRLITAAHVEEALSRRRWQRCHAEERHRDRLARRRLRVRTTGSAVGTVNSLLVYTIDAHRYAAPTRVTAITAVGREGVINVERESKLSGKTFDKGVFELVGFLRSRFCQRDPLGMVAMITFEQSYGRIDGDSAAAAELIAILSHLAATPVRQGIAITGSLSQRGELQAVGGTNLKIEGFHATCRDRGFEPGQGVIIPAANVEDLVLDQEVVESVENGSFSVWAVDTIEEALEIITESEVGVADSEGRYPADTLMGRAQKRMEEMSRRLFPPRKGKGEGQG